MQPFKLIKSPNQESEDPNDTPHTSRAGMPGQHFFIELFQLAANGHAVPMKGKVVIQSAFDVEYSCVIEHTVYVAESPEARMNILGMDFLAKFGEFISLRNPMPILTIFPGKSVKISPYLEKLFPYFSQVNSVELSQDLTIAPYSTRVLTLIAEDEDKHLFRKGTSFRLHKMFSTLGFILIMSTVHMINHSTS